MFDRIYRVLLLAAVVLALGASGAQAESFQRVHLRAEKTMKVWRSDRVLPDDRALLLGVYVKGREVDQRGISAKCRFSLMVHGLALEIRSCGNSPLAIRYIGHTRFTVTFKLGSR